MLPAVMAGRILAVGNLKGGTGKTTVAVNLGCSLASPRREVVLIDADNYMKVATLTSSLLARRGAAGRGGPQGAAGGRYRRCRRPAEAERNRTDKDVASVEAGSASQAEAGGGVPPRERAKTFGHGYRAPPGLGGAAELQDELPY